LDFFHLHTQMTNDKERSRHKIYEMKGQGICEQSLCRPLTLRPSDRSRSDRQSEHDCVAEKASDLSLSVRIQNKYNAPVNGGDMQFTCISKTP
jgi:hypothetical protein